MLGIIYYSLIVFWILSGFIVACFALNIKEDQLNRERWLWRNTKDIDPVELQHEEDREHNVGNFTKYIAPNLDRKIKSLKVEGLL